MLQDIRRKLPFTELFHRLFVHCTLFFIIRSRYKGRIHSSTSSDNGTASPPEMKGRDIAVAQTLFARSFCTDLTIAQARIMLAGCIVHYLGSYLGKWETCLPTHIDF